jgi:hypothetical protein
MPSEFTSPLKFLRGNITQPESVKIGNMTIHFRPSKRIPEGTILAVDSRTGEILSGITGITGIKENELDSR